MFGLIVRKELREIVGTTRFAATFGVVALLILLAFYLGGRQYLSSRSQYEAAVAENLRQLEGQTDWLQVRPSIYLPPRPLASLVTGISNDVGRNLEVMGMGTLRATESRYNEDPILAIHRFLDLEFIFGIVLSLFAILFAFDLISGEKERGTLRLALANAVPRDTFLLGKLTGAFLGLTVPLVIPFAMGALVLIAMGVPMSGLDWFRLTMVVAAGMLYVGAFLGLSVMVSALTHRSATSFLVLLVCWIMAVMVLPRTAVVLAARSIEVPSVDGILSQRGRLQAQLWEEDRAEIDRFFREHLASDHSDDGEVGGEVARFNKLFQELSEARTEKVEALAARLDEERLNRQLLQERLAFGLARISPAAAFSIAALQLAGTALELPRHYLDQARAYQRVFERFQKEKTGGRSSGGVMMVMRVAGQDDEEVAIDPHELPAFDYQDPPAGRILRGAVFDLGLLVLFNVLFIAGGFVAFLRYDVR
ncbi:MAG: ABC transporter permease subunit [bacterium]|nr:ABC transporter permease subunit [bacterium]